MENICRKDIKYYNFLSKEKFFTGFGCFAWTVYFTVPDQPTVIVFCEDTALSA